MDSWLPSSVRNVLRFNRADSFPQSSGSNITIDTVFSKPPKEVAPDSHVYEIHLPETEPELEVVFFHGFEFRDSREAYWKDWTSSDQSQCWPQTWLVEEFPKARILSVSYDSSLARGKNPSDMYITTETLSHGLLKGLVGQRPNSPVILVGHSIGGLVMKSLCEYYITQSHLSSSSGILHGQVANFTDNLKGLFFYGTPHLGSPLLSQNKTLILNGAPPTPLWEDMTVLSVDIARLNQQFSILQNQRRWNVYGVGEMLETELGDGIRGIVVPNASAAHGMGQCYSAIPADHFKICKPEDKNAIGFQLLAKFIRGILQQTSITIPDGMSGAT